jgi:hypothetical protein
MRLSKNAVNGALVEDIPASELVAGRNSSADYEKTAELGTLDEVIGLIGHGKKTSSETTDYYTWGDAGNGAYIEVAFAGGKVCSLGCMGNYQADKYEKIKLQMSFDEVIGILGEGKKTKTEVTDCYEWKYSDGQTILIWVTNNKIMGSSMY